MRVVLQCDAHVASTTATGLWTMKKILPSNWPFSYLTTIYTTVYNYTTTQLCIQLYYTIPYHTILHYTTILTNYTTCTTTYILTLLFLFFFLCRKGSPNSVPAWQQAHSCGDGGIQLTSWSKLLLEQPIKMIPSPFQCWWFGHTLGLAQEPTFNRGQGGATWNESAPMNFDHDCTI